tara:strand:- start:121713 stop:124142 length:2430 start_codon:yes stop_codon:yes gene_type:complete
MKTRRHEASLMFVLTLCLCGLVRADQPDGVTTFTREFCVDCHGAGKQKGEFRIDTLAWKLTDSESREKWELVRDYVTKRDMPPKAASKHPSAESRKAFLTVIDDAFTQADREAQVGGTSVRRLNRIEYLNTVRDIFGLRMINLPASFPEDATRAEFDTMPAGLFLSPAVMEGYHDVATSIADRFAPLPDHPTYQSSLVTETIGGDAGRRWFGPKKEFLKFTGFNQSGWVGALWDSLFVARASGIYRVRLLANAQAESGADGKPLRLSFYAFDPTEEQLPKRYRLERATLVAEVDVPTGEPTWIECDVPVEAGETFHVYCANRFSPDEYPTGDLNRSEVSRELKKLINRPEPTVELREMKIEGPVDVPPRVRDFFGHWPPNLNRAELESKLLPIAEQAYRRPLTDAEVERLIAAVLRHGQQSGRTEFAWHYAIRRLLCSPEFLYREAEDSQVLSEYALASRLSYFLWSTMPDDQLLDLAAAGTLSEPKTLAAQTQRLLSDPRSQQFVKHFTGQWLGNRTVASINVCDNRYEWDDNVRYGFVRSTEMFFEEVLRENLPIATFIDSDFTYANSAMQVVWGMKSKRDKTLGAVAARQRQSLVWPEPERISLSSPPPATPAHVLARGGVLGLPGVLTVTGDGVESSPILRGVWVLGNLFGQEPPPPPKDVPALDVDTSQATNVRETLAAHQKIVTCAKCHRDIDPFGLALENYDAVGGWRNSYLNDKSPIDATATMPDGTQLNGAESIRKTLLANPEIFTRCLLTKLLEYGAGRRLSVGDQRVVDEIVASAPEAGYRLQNLIIAATTSKVFLAR